MNCLSLLLQEMVQPENLNGFKKRWNIFLLHYKGRNMLEGISKPFQEDTLNSMHILSNTSRSDTGVKYRFDLRWPLKSSLRRLPPHRCFQLLWSQIYTFVILCSMTFVSCLVNPSSSHGFKNILGAPGWLSW